MDLSTEFRSKKQYRVEIISLIFGIRMHTVSSCKASVLDQNSKFVNVSSSNVISFKQAPGWQKRQNVNFHTDAHLYTL